VIANIVMIRISVSKVSDEMLEKVFIWFCIFIFVGFSVRRRVPRINMGYMDFFGFDFSFEHSDEV